MTMEHSKPPLGLKPRIIFLEERADALKEAIQRYFDAGQEVPINWIEEYNIIRSELNGDGMMQKLVRNIPIFPVHPNT